MRGRGGGGRGFGGPRGGFGRGMRGFGRGPLRMGPRPFGRPGGLFPGFRWVGGGMYGLITLAGMGLAMKIHRDDLERLEQVAGKSVSEMSEEELTGCQDERIGHRGCSQEHRRRAQGHR